MALSDDDTKAKNLLETVAKIMQQRFLGLRTLQAPPEREGEYDLQLFYEPSAFNSASGVISEFVIIENITGIGIGALKPEKVDSPPLIVPGNGMVN